MIKMDEADVVEDLLLNPFSRRSFSEKETIIEMGRPCPALPNLKSECKQKNGTYTRKFQTSQYDLHLWLCGSYKLNKLFCWPCLLFSSSKSIWSKEGFENVKSLTHSQYKHKVSLSHLQCIIALNDFNKQRIDELLDDPLKISNTEHNEKVAKNREILKRLIDVTCFLGKQDLAFLVHDESQSLSNKGNYLELLDLIKVYDPLLKDHLESASIFKGTSPTIQNDLISAVSGVIEEEILEEVKKTPFIAIMLDETSDIQMNSQMSSVVRYVINGEIKERFLGFTDVSSDRTSGGLLPHVENLIKKLGAGDKLVAQTYDGAAVMPDHLNGLQQKVKEKFKNALHVHSYAHVLNLVLSQSFSDIKPCNIFFQTLNGISTFASHSTCRTFTLKEFLKRQIPSLTTVRWSFTSRLVNVVNEYSSEIGDYFSHILNGDEWNVKDKMAAKGYMKFLSKFETIFLLKVFSTLYAYTDAIFNILQQKDVDIMFCAQKIENFLTVLKKMGENEFQTFWNETNGSAVCDPKENEKRKKQNDYYSIPEMPEAEDRYRHLYFQIIDRITQQVKDRFGSIKKLNFLNLIQPSPSKVIEDRLSSLMSTYGDYFDPVTLKNELIVFNTSTSLHEEVKSATEILKHLLNSELLSTGFLELKKLCTLICTVPATTESVERSFSALKRIKTYIRSTQTQNRPCNLSLISIERELLNEISTKNGFHDKVIAKFVKANRVVEFIF